MTVAGWLRALAGAGTLATDSEEQRLPKTVLTVAVAGFIPLGLVWGLAYLVLGLQPPSAAPVAFSLLSAANLTLFLATKRYRLFRVAELGMVLVLPFALQVTLGGFAASGGVMLWALCAPLGTLALQGPRMAWPWAVAYLLLMAGAAVAEPLLTPTVVPPTVRTLFFVANATGVSAVVYLVLQHAFRTRQEARDQAERLLLNVLPRAIAERLRHGAEPIADGFPEVAVLFADICDFTELSSHLAPERLVAFLNDLFTAFDELAERHGLEKIKTIGDCYMVAGGLPDARLNPTAAVADMALDMLALVATRRSPDGRPLRLRAGIHIGPVVAGVIGAKKFAYDLWGDTVNTASRMESHGAPNTIHVSAAAYQALGDGYEFEARGLIDIKGKGPLETYFLRGKRKAVPA